ncbi:MULTISPECIES: TolC family protein [Gammaproteobacteria]|uniref:TolC family protein n=1 Tax=Gammaproteobacteria TaxID=1236 RepID=UPI000477085A|nr:MULTISPECIES: TolC family protein [Gammaproteobacteria]MDC9566925.1 TolC family protein [Pseudoalteromonas sp. GAB2316C]MDC9571151.1 TolC family protein [Pseudoalteromonas sp. GABNB9D]MDC9575346.1 TolC family protein [Pseudoalteromonas sp. GABNS16A]MDC9579642.1 TolC family protein [Pseudoalteromonas sp. GABNS16E]MDC9587360.1 TolC family protein [Pseudoalteromonas sp. GABNS16C]
MRYTTFNRCLKPCVWLAFLLCNLTITANAADIDATLTLNKALTRTLAHNPHLYQYRFTQEALNAQRQTSALRPAMGLELEVENFAGSGSNEGFDSAETTLALSSVIELGGKRQARLSYANARINQAEWEQQAATLDVLGELTAIYVEGLATQANMQLAEESLELSQSLLRTVKARSKQGATPEAEVMRAQAAVARAEIRLAALVEQLERQKVQLSRFWGDTSSAFTKLEGSLFEFGPNQSFEQLYARVKTSPAIQVFASEARIKDAQVTLARAGGRSDLTWRAGIKRFEETGDSAFTAGLSIPLFSNKRSSGEVKAALANRNAVDYARQDLLLRLHAQLFEAYSLRKQSIEAANKTQNVVIPALENALKLTREAYENGRYRYLDLIAAQEELLATKQARIDAASTALISQALIEKLSSEALNQ